MDILKELRKSKNITQGKLSETLGVSRSTISMWETNACEPDNETVSRIADLFSVSTDYLLGRTDDPAPPHEKAPTVVYDAEALELMEEMHKRDELKVLFSVSKNATKEDIEFVNEMLKRFKREQEGDD